MNGYALTWRTECVLSVVTHSSSHGQQDMLIGLLGVNTHEHLWVAVPSNLSTSGRRLKDRGAHVSSAASLPSTGPFARVAAVWDSSVAQPVVALAELGQESAVSAMPAAPQASPTEHRERIDLGHATATSLSIEFHFLPSSQVSAWNAGPVLDWGPSAVWVVGVRISSSNAV